MPLPSPFLSTIISSSPPLPQSWPSSKPDPAVKSRRKSIFLPPPTPAGGGPKLLALRLLPRPLDLPPFGANFRSLLMMSSRATSILHQVLAAAADLGEMGGVER